MTLRTVVRRCRQRKLESKVFIACIIAVDLRYLDKAQPNMEKPAAIPSTHDQEVRLRGADSTAEMDGTTAE